jgi:hypothetical protein
LYKIIITTRRLDNNTETFWTDSRRPVEAAEALRWAEEAVDRGANVKIIDMETEKSITLAQFRKAAALGR